MQQFINTTEPNTIISSGNCATLNSVADLELKHLKCDYKLQVDSTKFFLDPPYMFLAYLI